MKEIKNICVIGAGSWGTTLSILLGGKGYNVRLWCRRKELAEEINKIKENKEYLKNIKIPDTVITTHSIKDATTNSNIVVFAVPSEFLRFIVKKASVFLDERAIIMHVVKGLEESTGKLMSQVFEEELPRNSIAVLSGPNHAEEIAQKLPTATVIASKEQSVREFLCDIFSTQEFKAYPHDDVIGVEICGVIKNIIAIAIGVCDGLKLGDNAKASILTLGLSEMSKVARNFGAKRTTCFGLAGVGDLIATCYSEHSRNRFVGEMLAKAKPLDKIKEEMHGMVAEGVRNTKTIYYLCKKKNIEPPLIFQIYKVLYEDLELKKGIDQLLNMV